MALRPYVGDFVQLFELSGSLVRLISLRTPDGGEERNPCGGHAAHTRTDSHFPHSFVLFSSPSLVPRRLVRASMPPAPLSKEYVSSFLPVFTVCRGTDDASFWNETVYARAEWLIRLQNSDFSLGINKPEEIIYKRSVKKIKINKKSLRLHASQSGLIFVVFFPLALIRALWTSFELFLVVGVFVFNWYRHTAFIVLLLQDFQWPYDVIKLVWWIQHGNSRGYHTHTHTHTL